MPAFRRLGDWEIGKLGDWETGKLGNSVIGRFSGSQVPQSPSLQITVRVNETGCWSQRRKLQDSARHTTRRAKVQAQEGKRKGRNTAEAVRPSWDALCQHGAGFFAGWKLSTVRGLSSVTEPTQANSLRGSRNDRTLDLKRHKRANRLKRRHNSPRLQRGSRCTP